MKKLMVISLVLCLIVAVGAVAKTKTAAGSKDKPVTGWISDEMCAAKHAKEGGEACVKKCIGHGAAPALVTDGGNKVLKIDNPEAVKGHEGHHVQVTGHTDAAKGTIHVAELKMLGTAAGNKK